MGFTLERMAELRPYVFHLTHRDNVPLIAKAMRLRCAADLLKEGARLDVLRVCRRGLLALNVNGATIQVRDQDPLHAGNVSLRGGWDFGDYVEALNRRVFFWPGRDATEPIQSGVNHFARYAAENPAILRVATAALVEANGPREPEFARYNTGAPRCIAPSGRGSPRGPDTFRDASACDFSPNEVVEFTFPREAVLPKGAVSVKLLNANAWRQLA